MPSKPSVSDKDGNKPIRSDEESLANRNVTRPAPLEADRVTDATLQKEKHVDKNSTSDPSR